MRGTAVDYLVGSDNRIAVLRVLRDRGPLSARALETRVDASRRTLKRTLDGMATRGWVVSPDAVQGYDLTALGRAVLSGFEAFRARERLAERLRPFLEHAPARAYDVDLDALADATLTVATPDDPYGPIDRLLDLRTGATRLRQCVPFLLTDSVLQLAERVADTPRAATTLVLSEVGPSSSADPTYRERFEALADSPAVDVRLCPDPIRVAVGLADGHAFFGVMADGSPHALLDGDDPALVRWTEAYIADLIARSDPL
jgi:DNA-binding HxlR family transcriptional regulator